MTCRCQSPLSLSLSPSVPPFLKHHKLIFTSIISVFPLIWTNPGQWPPLFGGSFVQNPSFTNVITFFQASVNIFLYLPIDGELKLWRKQPTGTTDAILWRWSGQQWSLDSTNVSFAEIHQNRPCLLSSVCVFTVLSRSWGSGQQLEGRLWAQKGQKQSWED